MLPRLAAAILFAVGLGIVSGHAQFGPAVFTAQPSGGGSGIAFVRAADIANNGGSTSSISASFDATGCNVLLIGIAGATVGGADDLTAVTYNSVSATLDIKNVSVSSGSPSSNNYLYRLNSPATGSHTVSITAGSSHALGASVACYSGANAAGQPDATGSTSTGGSPASIITSVTTIANNDWVIVFETGFNGNNPPTAGSGLTRRTFDATFGAYGFFDSGAAITPAGSNNFTVNTQGGASNSNTTALAIKP